MESNEQTSETESQIDWSELVIAGVYAFAIGVNVYIIIDQLSDGALSRSISVRARNVCGRVREEWRVRSRFRRDAAHVVFEAMTIVDEEGTE